MTRIQAPAAWDVRTDASAAVVAVIDTGVRYTHEDLAANMWVNPGEIPGNGLDDDGDGYVDDVYGINAITGSGDPWDDNSHGTHCAGTIGGVGNNARGVAGVAWRVKLMACKFLDATGYGVTSDAIKCIDYARAKGAHVMNNSWGGVNGSKALRDAIAAADGAGIIFVAAAGNDTNDNDAHPFYPSSFDLPNVVAVAATDNADNLASFSNYGATTVDLAAPGVAIYSSVAGGDSDYTFFSGTSMATPHVAGAFALLKAQYPGETHLQLIQRLLTATDQLPSLVGKTRSGGRLNVYKAIQPAAGALANGTPYSDSITATTPQTGWKYYYLDVPASATLTIDLYNLTDNADLYVRFGSMPTLSAYDCRPFSGSTSSERCQLTTSTAGRWWIGVDNYVAGTIGYTVKAAYTVSCTYTLSSTSASFGASGGLGAVSVTAPSTCPWTATSSAIWVTLDNTGTAYGNGTVVYHVDANKNRKSRAGSIGIAGMSFVVNQAAR